MCLSAAQSQANTTSTSHIAKKKDNELNRKDMMPTLSLSANIEYVFDNCKYGVFFLPRCSSVPCKYHFRVTNRGQRFHQLFWCSEGQSPFRHWAKGSPRDSKARSTLSPEATGPPVFSLSPTRLELSPGQSADMVLEGSSEVPKVSKRKQKESSIEWVCRRESRLSHCAGGKKIYIFLNHKNKVLKTNLDKFCLWCNLWCRNNKNDSQKRPPKLHPEAVVHQGALGSVESSMEGVWPREQKRLHRNAYVMAVLCHLR